MNVFFATAVTLILTTSVALAQDSSIAIGKVVELASAFLLPIISVLAAAVAGWLANLLRQKWGLEIDAKNREALQTAITNAAGLAIAKGASLAADKTIDVKNPAIAAAVNYAIAAAPDAIKYFKLTPEAIAQKLAAKMGVMGSAVPVVPVAPNA